MVGGLISHFIDIFSFFHSGHLENYPKWRVAPKISTVNILIVNWGGGGGGGGPTNNVEPLPEGRLAGCMVTPPGPWINSTVRSKNI